MSTRPRRKTTPTGLTPQQEPSNLEIAKPIETSPLRKALNDFIGSGAIMPDGDLVPLPADTIHWIERVLRPNLKKFVETVKQQC